ncbi:hypothetical protein LCGC14_1423210 [marine sediment metagenome]|uniref:Uncharacterized protein n=1 Tax=marine sediment metagenome TaxID=412755 RepID=A0A0F9M669_9ZZZZ
MTNKPPLLSDEEIWAVVEEAEEECDANSKLGRAIHEYRKIAQAQDAKTAKEKDAEYALRIVEMVSQGEAREAIAQAKKEERK